MFSKRQLRYVPLLSALCLAATAASAPAVNSHYAPIGVRSHGLGGTGTADDFDVANVVYNPALISTLQQIQATGQYNNDNLYSTDQKYYGGTVGYGHRWALGETMTFSGGIGLGYVRLRYDHTRTVYSPAGLQVFYDRSLIFTGAGLVGYGEWLRIGVGCNVKEKESWYESDTGSEEAGDSRVFYDLGLFLSADILRREGYTLSGAAGFAYLHITDREEVSSSGDYSDYQRVTYYPPEYRRYGLHACFSTSSKPWMDDFFKTEVPAIAVTVDFDVEDLVTKRSWGEEKNTLRSGIELAVLQVMFLRVGYIDDRTYPVWIQQATWGGGLGMTYGRFSARIDVSHSPSNLRTLSTTREVERYGLTLGVDL